MVRSSLFSLVAVAVGSAFARIAWVVERAFTAAIAAVATLIDAAFPAAPAIERSALDSVQAESGKPLARRLVTWRERFFARQREDHGLYALTFA